MWPLRLLLVTAFASASAECSYVEAIKTPIVEKEHCQPPPEAAEFLSKFALNPHAILVFASPTPKQLANNSFADENDRSSISLLASARQDCFTNLNAVNADPQGRVLFNGTNLILARVYNREISFGKANEMGIAMQQEIMTTEQSRIAADKEHWARVAASGAAIYLTSLRSQVQTDRTTVLNCSTMNNGQTQNTQCVAQ
jgi:hypothetical protein